MYYDRYIMIALKLYDYYFNTDTISDKLILRSIDIFRNLYALLTVVPVVPLIYNYVVYESFYEMNYVVNVLKVNLFIDCFFVDKYEVYLHHIFGFLLIIGSNYIDDEIIITPIMVMLSTEISSIFLSCKNLIEKFYVLRVPYLENIKNTSIYEINNWLFLITFFITRILYYGYYFILSNNFKNIINKRYSENEDNNYMTNLLLVAIYGVLFLNIYWFGIILKIAYSKNLIKHK